jgi:hypothetical protein
MRPIDVTVGRAARTRQIEEHALLATRLAKAEADRADALAEVARLEDEAKIVRADMHEARAAIARVREIHAPNEWDECPVCCTHEPDGQAYASAPSCDTVRALDPKEPIA